MRTLGVLLAGGRGRRMESATPKALLTCGGRTLLERALHTLAEVSDPVVVVAPRDLALPVPAAQRIVDPPHAEGPLAAMVAGLGSRRFEEAVVFAVDLPLVSAPALLALRAQRGEALAVAAAPGGRLQPLAAWFAPAAFARLADSVTRGERAATAAVLALDPVVVGDAVLASLAGGIEAWRNVNTPADLAWAEARLAGVPRP